MASHKSADATVAAKDAVPVTPSDVTVFPITRSLWVGTAGNLAVRMADSQRTVTLAVPVGVIPFQVDQVRATGTTASGIFALY